MSTITVTISRGADEEEGNLIVQQFEYLDRDRVQRKAQILELTASDSVEISVVNDTVLAMKFNSRELPIVSAIAHLAGETLLVPAPTAAFSGSDLTGTAPLEVTFTDASTNDPTSWSWEKSDDAGENWVPFDTEPAEQNPVETLAAGTWSIRLTATNAGGSDVEEKIDYIEVTA